MNKNTFINFISQNIKHLRSDKNLGQDDFAALFDLSRDVIGTYERGKAVPKLETIQMICQHFDITIDDFVNKDLRTLRMDRIWNEGETSVSEPAALRGNEAYMQKTIDTQEKMIEMLTAEIKRLKGDQDYNSKTA